MDPRFLQEGLQHKLHHAAEETGELNEKLGLAVAAVGDLTAALMKTARWGPDSVDPTIPLVERETNRDWVRRARRNVAIAIHNTQSELVDLERTMDRLTKELDQ